jgi:hypothetical protein
MSSGAGSQAGYVLAALPKSAQPDAVAAMREIYNAEDIDKAQIAIKAFEIDYGTKVTGSRAAGLPWPTR